MLKITEILQTQQKLTPLAMGESLKHTTKPTRDQFAVKHEYQVYGRYLMTKLQATDNSLSTLCKLAKYENRILVERALEATLGSKKGYQNMRVFMYQLKKQKGDQKIKMKS